MMRVLTFFVTLVLLSPQDPGGASAKDSFELAFEAASGPGKLEELRQWCSQNKLPEEKKRVEELFKKIRPPEKPSPDFAKRAQQRAARAQARKVVSDFLATRSRNAMDEIGKIVAWMKAEGFGSSEARERLNGLIRKLIGAEGEGAADLLSQIDQLSGGSDRGQSKQFDLKVGSLVKGLTDRLFAAVDKCIAVNEPGLAFELFRFALRIDPENARAHKSLAHQKIQDRWLRPYDAEQYRAGLAWDGTLGWVLMKEKARYEEGDYYVLETKKWSPLKDLNDAHAKAVNPWKLRSEHFILNSTADLALTAQVLSRLEAFFLHAFGEYDLFFAKGSSGQGAQLIFGVAPLEKRLNVFFYRDADQFSRYANPPTNWAAGYYDPSKHASYFHAVEEGLSPEILQHELTHQILGEFSTYGGAPPWLAEGAAVYLENAALKDGALAQGDLRERREVWEYCTQVQEGHAEHSFKSMLGFRTARDWDRGDIDRNYRGAGALVYFLMTMDGGRYRGDFIEMLRDHYSNTSRPVEDYFGLSTDSLDFLMQRFYKGYRS